MKMRMVLSREDHKKLDKTKENFLSDNKGFFDFLEKFPAKDFQECLNKYIAQSYLEFLKKYDAKLYKKFISDESVGGYYNNNKNLFDGWSPDNLETAKKALSRSIDFYGKGGRLTKERIKIYYKTFERYDSEKRDGKKPKWTEVFRWTTQSKDEKGNPLISDEQDRKRILKDFYKFKNENNIKSLKDFIIYLQHNNYPIPATSLK
jgi:hypothetical protein